MVDALILVTQISSLVTFILIVVAVALSFISLFKFTENDEFRLSILFLALYLIFLMLSVGFMSLYHWLYSELMETFWYIGLNVGLLFGIVSGIFSISFWKRINLKKKDVKKRA